LHAASTKAADSIAAWRSSACDTLSRVSAGEAQARAELAKHGWKVDYIAIRHGLALRIPHPESYDHPNLLIVLGAASIGTTRLIDNVDVVAGAVED
jgi:pantoate--beta-alanine ligase